MHEAPLSPPHRLHRQRRHQLPHVSGLHGVPVQRAEDRRTPVDMALRPHVHLRGQLTVIVCLDVGVFHKPPNSCMESYIATTFSVGVTAWMLWQGAQIHCAPEKISMFCFTSFITSSTVPNGRVCWLSMAP